MINDFIKNFVAEPIPLGQEYAMDNIILCPINYNLIYNIIFIKIPMPKTDNTYSEDDIFRIFERSLKKAIDNIVFYSSEYLYNYNGQSFKIKFNFEEMKLYQKKKVFFHNMQNSNNKFYNDIADFIKLAGKEGRTLNELSYKFFRNHRHKQQQIINQLEESGDFIITKTAGLHNKPRTVFIDLEK
jgi:chloramphenicol O-acetyltransferase